MIDAYRDVLAAIGARLLRETRDPGEAMFPVHMLRDLHAADEGEPQLDDLLEYIANATEGAVSIVTHAGKRQVKVHDPVALYLMVHSLDRGRASPDLLHWQAFERLVRHALGENGFVTRNNVRFTDPTGKRHEIDVVAADKYGKEHLVLVIDAKNWNFKTSSSSRVVDAANQQFTRAVALGESPDALSRLLFDMGLPWTNCIILPMVVTLLAPPVANFYIPIVSIMAFNQFVHEFADNMDFFKKKIVNGVPVQKRLG